MDQYRGRRNIIQDDNMLLGQVGYVVDQEAVAGTQLQVPTTGVPIRVRIVKKDGATSGLVGGLGVTYKAGSEGIEVDALSGAAGFCDGVIDPDITTDLADGDTFLLFEHGPVDVTSSAAFTAGNQVKPAASGKFGPTVGNEQGVGRAVETAAGADETKRVFINCSITGNGLIA